MNNVIRIRAWHTQKQEMFSPEEMAADQLALLPTGEFANIHSTDTRLSQILPRDQFIPLQSSLLSDMDGREIFSGDVVDFGGLSYAISWIDAGFALTNPEYVFQPLTEAIARDLHILGNIYATPSLNPAS